MHELVYRWVTGAFADDAALCSALDDAGIAHEPHLKYLALVVRIDAYRRQMRKCGADAVYKAKQVLLTLCEAHFPSSLCTLGAEAYVVVLLIREDFVKTHQMIDPIAAVRGKMEERFDMSLTVGIGSHAIRPWDVPESLRNAHIATRYRMVYGSGQDIEYESIAMRVGSCPAYPAALEDTVIDAWKKGDAAAYEKRLARYFLRVWSASVNFGQAASSHLLMAIYRQMDEATQADCDFAGTYQELQNCDFYEQQLAVICKFGLSHMTQGQPVTLSRHRGLVDKMLGYIGENYHNPDLSVVSIAEHVNLSQNTVRQLFRSQGLLSPKDYILKVRMEKACHLLDTTKDSAKDIADRVGYKESRYFYNVFKKYAGMTAFEYRNRGG